MALGKYEILCRLSSGGMSEIFLAYQRGIGGFRKIVALKTILPDTRGHEEIVRMFLNEARLSAEFSHPNIVQVYDLGIENDMLFLAMEYVQGCNVLEMVRACHASQQKIPMGFSLAIARDTALALFYAHTFVDMRHRKRPIIHRDVAGKNIMVTHEGITKLLDFGIAKMEGTSSYTFAGTVKGTTGYMSPEQLLGLPLDGRSDIFSLGIVIHECLTGLRLFHETPPEKKKTAVLDNTIQPPSSLNPKIPSALDEVVMKALKRSPEHRFQTALEFARALEEAAGEHIWRAEQVGALVSQHFSQRREQTRKLIEEVQTRLNETTGQIQIDAFLSEEEEEEALLYGDTPGDNPPEQSALKEDSPSLETENDTLSLIPSAKLQQNPPLTPSPVAHFLPTPERSALIPIQLPLPQKNVAPKSSPHVQTTNTFLQLLSSLLSNRKLVLIVLLLLILFLVVLFFLI
ncbi:MAG: serine/threonine protein kinase [Cystobacterineae bacterium]|nr:serine/threonine protein kinase [Cystobacterineae bacterium]